MSAAPANDTNAPKRPLSSYNLFFLLERKRIIDGTDQQDLPVSPKDVHTIALEHESKPRRRHRKSHGLISFRDLAKTLAERWKTLDSSKKKVFDEEAKALWVRYENRMVEWNAKMAVEGTAKPAVVVKKKPNVRLGSESCSASSSSVQSGLAGFPAAGTTQEAKLLEAALTLNQASSLQRARLAAAHSLLNQPNYITGSSHSGHHSVSDLGSETESEAEAKEAIARNLALEQAKRIVQQTIHNYTLGLAAQPQEVVAAKRSTIQESQLPKKKQKVVQNVKAFSSCYRFDLNDPVEVTKNRVQFMVRGKPRCLQPIEPGSAGLAALTTGKEELRDVTESLIKFHAGRLVKFEKTQMLSVTFIFAFPPAWSNGTVDSIQQEGSLDQYVKFVMDALFDLLFETTNQVVSLQARKKFDIPGGSGYTSVLLEVDQDFRR